MYTYRRNLTVQKNDKGELFLTLPEDVLELMGVQDEGDQLFWRLFGDGKAELSKKPQ